jgi:hypothetical protein
MKMYHQSKGSFYFKCVGIFKQFVGPVFRAFKIFKQFC